MTKAPAAASLALSALVETVSICGLAISFNYPFTVAHSMPDTPANPFTSTAPNTAHPSAARPAGQTVRAACLPVQGHSIPELAGAVGIEPTTSGFGDQRSAN